MREVQYDWDAIFDLDKKAKIKAIKSISKVANERLRQLEKRGLTKNAYKYAQEYARKEIKPRYNIRHNTEQSLNYTLRALQRFITAQTSTISGYKRIQKSRQARLARQLGTDDTEEVFRFLKSAEYATLKRMYPSEQILDEYLYYKRELGMTHDEIMMEFRNFLNSEMSFYELRATMEEKYGAS